MARVVCFVESRSNKVSLSMKHPRGHVARDVTWALCPVSVYQYSTVGYLILALSKKRKQTNKANRIN